MARRARFVHRRRADRIETAEERKDWIFVLDLAESMAESVMVQRKKIKTVTWTAFAPVFTRLFVDTVRIDRLIALS